MASSQLAFIVAFVLGIGPAFALLYYSLRRYDRPFTEHTLFDDRRVFFAFFVGMVFGVIVAVLNFVLLLGAPFPANLAFLFSILTFEEMFKLVYLNRRGYQQRFDTTFYGLSLGVGAASTAVMGGIVWGSPNAITDPVGLAYLVLFSVNLSLVNADTGALLGFGASQGNMWGSFAKALAVRWGHYALLFAYLQLAPDPWPLVSILTALAFAGIVYHYVYTQLLPASVPEDVRRGMRRRARRAKALKE